MSSVLLAVSAACSASPALGVVAPPTARARIHALMAPYDYLPAKLPPGLIYIRWRQESLSPSVCGSVATVTFAAVGGKQVEWATSRSCDGRGEVGCFSDGYPGYSFGLPVDLRARINGRLVFFSRGNHGSNAWTCIPTRTAGLADEVAVGIWESNFMTPKAAMRLVARARR